MPVNNGHCELLWEPEPIRCALVSIYGNSLWKCGSNWNAFWFWAPRIYTNIDSPENRLAECSVRFIYIQRAVLGCLFEDGRRTDELCVLTAWELFAIACTSKEVIANLIRLFGWCDRRRNAFGNDYNPSQQLWLDAGENRSHCLCTISVNVDCRDEFVVLLWSICNE